MPWFPNMGRFPMTPDGEIDTIQLNNTKTGISATPDSSNNKVSKSRMPVAISVPGNIITEEGGSLLTSIQDELFEDLSIFELMDFGRSDMVLGQNVTYQPIKNISDIYFTYDPKKILGLAGTFIESTTPSSLNLSEFSVDGAVSIDPATGDLIIAVDKMKKGFLVQVELVSGGEIQDS